MFQFNRKDRYFIYQKIINYKIKQKFLKKNFQVKRKMVYTSSYLKKIKIRNCTANVSFKPHKFYNGYEKITTGYVYELADGDYDDLTVMYFENPKYGKASSLVKDENLISGNIHILNRNLRAVVMRDLDLRANEVVYDIGAGCGAMAVEIALISDRSRVYAIDKNVNAVDLIERNCALYTVSNVRTISGDAMDVTGSLPKPDAVLIEGYDGNVIDLVRCLGRLNNIRLVVVTRNFDDAYKLIELMHKNYFENIELKQISVNEGKNYGRGTHMEHEDTCFIIKGTGEITG